MVLYGPRNNIISHSSYANSRYPMEKSHKGVGFLGWSGPGIFTFLQFQLLNSFNLTTVWFVVMLSLRSILHSEDSAKPTTLLMERPNHNTENMPFSFQLVNGIFNVSQNLWTLERCETRSLRFIFLVRQDFKVWLFALRCYNKGSTLSSVILIPCVLFQAECNSRSPAWQPWCSTNRASDAERNCKGSAMRWGAEWRKQESEEADTRVQQMNQ